jgi:hypothetical protein
MNRDVTTFKKIANSGTSAGHLQFFGQGSAV